MTDVAKAGALDGFDRRGFLSKLAVPGLTMDDVNEIARKDAKADRRATKATGAEVPKPPPAAEKPLEIPPDPPKTIIDWETGDNRVNCSIVRQAIKSGAIRISQLPEGVETLAEKVMEIYEGAVEQGKSATALQAIKLVKEIQQQNLDTIKFLDTAQRLDDGKPTSITASATPERMERIKQIISASKGPLPPELIARAAAKAMKEQDGGNAEL